MRTRRGLARTAVLAAVAVLPLVPGQAASAGPRAVLLAEGRDPASLPEGARPLFEPRTARALAAAAGRSGRRAPDLRRWYLVPGDGTAPPPPSPAFCRPVGAVDGIAAVPLPTGPGAVRDLGGLQDVRRDMAMEGLPVGGDGAGVRVASVEFDWNPDHIELDGRVPSRPSYRRSGGERDVSHGTASLSLIGGRRDGQGITGLAPAALLRPVSPVRGAAVGDYVPPAAIAQAAAGLRPGDVLLVELQSEDLGPVDTGDWGPSTADAVAAAVAAGIVVVLPAGNAGEDVAVFGSPRADDAILVGGGRGSGSGILGTRVPESNHGRRVDVQGPATGVVAATSSPSYYDYLVGDPDTPARSYTHCFNGTSSAAAAVAGAVASTQGIARATRGYPFTPAEIRARLLATGLPQPDAASGRIGPVPQVRAAADLTPPGVPSGLSPAPGAQVPAGEVTLRWRSPDDDAAAASGRAEDILLIDGQEAARMVAGPGEARVRLDAGAHVWSVRATDRAGNASQADARLVVTARPPSSARGSAPPSALGAAGALRSAAWAGGRRTLVLRVRVARGARVAVLGRVRRVARGVVRVPLRPPRRRARTVTVVLTGPGLVTARYRLRLTPRGAPRVTRLR